MEIRYYDFKAEVHHDPRGSRATHRLFLRLDRDATMTTIQRLREERFSDFDRIDEWSQTGSEQLERLRGLVYGIEEDAQ